MSCRGAWQGSVDPDGSGAEVTVTVDVTPFTAASISSGTPDTSVAFGADANELLPTRWRGKVTGPC